MQATASPADAHAAARHAARHHSRRVPQRCVPLVSRRAALVEGLPTPRANAAISSPSSWPFCCSSSLPARSTGAASCTVRAVPCDWMGGACACRARVLRHRQRHFFPLLQTRRSFCGQVAGGDGSAGPRPLTRRRRDRGGEVPAVQRDQRDAGAAGRRGRGRRRRRRRHAQGHRGAARRRVDVEAAGGAGAHHGGAGAVAVAQDLVAVPVRGLLGLRAGLAAAHPHHLRVLCAAAAQAVALPLGSAAAAHCK